MCDEGGWVVIYGYIWGMSEDLGVEGGVVWLYMGICGYEEV